MISVDFTKTYKIDLGSMADPPLWLYIRKVKYWKGHKYVYFDKKQSVYSKVLDRMVDELTKSIDREILNSIYAAEVAAGNNPKFVSKANFLGFDA